jgi:DNA end-binding protein Ku
MAEALVESLAAEFEPSKYRDEYRENVLDLIERKAAGETFEQPVASIAAPQVVDLMAVLEASVAAAKQARKRHPTAKPKPAVAASAEKPKRVRKSA